jgi:hypothetical protein
VLEVPGVSVNVWAGEHEQYIASRLEAPSSAKQRSKSLVPVKLAEKKDDPRLTSECGVCQIRSGIWIVLGADSDDMQAFPRRAQVFKPGSLTRSERNYRLGLTVEGAEGR